MSDWKRELRPRARRLGRIVFGDRIGLTLFLGLLTAIAITWRVGFFIQADEFALGNTLVAVADGHLDIRQIQYSFSLQTQMGLHEYGGRLYGRNYGQVFMALPFLFALEAATVVAPLHLVLASGFSLVALAFVDQFATVTGRERLRGVGSAIVLGLFASTALLTPPLDPILVELAALQLTSIFGAAFAGVLLYRLFGLFGERVLGLGGGVAVAIALPIGVWAAIPKRHVVVSMLLLAAVYCFARSRSDSGRSALLSTAGAYVAAGLVASILSLEGLVAVVALGFADVVTGGVRDRRQVAAVAVGILVGLAPMLLTNALISGNPIRPPRMLDGYSGQEFGLSSSGEVVNRGEAANPETETNAAAGGSGSEPTGESTAGAGNVSGPTGESTAGAGNVSGSETGGGTNTGGDGQTSTPSAPTRGAIDRLLAPFWGILDQVAVVVGVAVAMARAGVGVLTDGQTMWHLFVRSGHIPGVPYAVNGHEAIELTVVESMPLVGSLLAFPALVLRRLRRESGLDVTWRPWMLDAQRQTDVFVVVLAASFTLLYLPRFPVRTQITVRYLLPVFPLALYGILRFQPVREAVTATPRRLAEGYAATVLVGVVSMSLLLAGLDVAVGEAMQFHALVNLSLAVGLACLVGGRALVPERVPAQIVTDGLGVTAGATTAFVVLARFEYFSHGPFVVSISRVIADVLPVF